MVDPDSGSIATQDADHDSLYLAVVDDDRIELDVGGLQSDPAVLFLVERLEGRFALRKKGHDPLSVARGLSAFDDDVVSTENTFILHRVSLDLQGEGRTDATGSGSEEGFQVERFIILHSFDGIACGDSTDEGEADPVVHLVGQRVVFSNR